MVALSATQALASTFSPLLCASVGVCRHRPITARGRDGKEEKGDKGGEKGREMGGTGARRVPRGGNKVCDEE